MLKAQFWTTSVARVELDQRARDARLQEHDRRLDAVPGEQIADAYLTRFAARSGREAKRAIFIAERNGVFAGFAVGLTKTRVTCSRNTFR